MMFHIVILSIIFTEFSLQSASQRPFKIRRCLWQLCVFTIVHWFYGCQFTVFFSYAGLMLPHHNHNRLFLCDMQNLYPIFPLILLVFIENLYFSGPSFSVPNLPKLACIVECTIFICYTDNSYMHIALSSRRMPVHENKATPKSIFPFSYIIYCGNADSCCYYLWAVYS